MADAGEARGLFSGWLTHPDAPRGVGIDLVCVSELRALDERLQGAFVWHTFTEAERAESKRAPERWTFLAGRYAAKEAVFKALAPLIGEKGFDFRRVETLTRADGSPAVTLDDFMARLLAAADADALLVSITHEGDCALALAQAVQKGQK